MSSHQEFRAKYKLPSAEVPKFRKRMNASAQAFRDDVKNEAQRALDAGVYEDYGNWRRKDDKEISYEASDVIGALKTNAPGAKKVTQKAVDEIVPKPTNKSTKWGCVRLDPQTREVTLSLEGNWALSHAGEERWEWCPAWSALNSVKWTRGSGGSSVSTDEYARDAAMEYGDDPMSRNDHKGPIGWAEFEFRMGFPHPESPKAIKAKQGSSGRYRNGVGSNQHRTRAGSYR